MKVIFRMLLVISLIAIVAACGGKTHVRDHQPVVDSNSVGARAQARWDALIERQYAQAYQYYTPGFRSSTPLDRFAGGFAGGRVIWEQAEYVDEECEEDRCVVRLRVTYAYLQLAPGVDRYPSTRTVKETWIRLDDHWYYTP